MAELRLHFTIGPVQKFVAQSRRTRDLWGSSYLLSYLAGKAMLGALETADRSAMNLPAVTRDTIETLLAKEHATLPNRFVLAVADEELGRKAGQAAQAALMEAWIAVADAVWDEYLAGVASARTREVWERQVAGFWETAWIVSAEPAALARRKTWRTPSSQPEPGDHCTMMGSLQELSGCIGHRERSEQRAFWDAVRQQPNVSTLDLGDDERLSAVAFIKRFFPKLGAKLTGAAMNTINWPSTAYIAAVPWIEEVMKKSDRIAANYAELVKGGAGSVFGERNTKIASLQRFSGEKFVQLDGNFFFDEALASESRTPLREESSREQLRSALRDLNRQSGAAPAPYYALLLMDGDSMGELIGSAQKHGCVPDASGALVDFAAEVPGIVKAHDGVAIYAGGDDVLALVSSSRAIACAAKLAEAYRQSFAVRLKHPELVARATLSGAIVFAHYRAAFSTINGYAHKLLDDVAKDATGRDSLAVAVYKASGLALQWSAPWGHIRQEEGTIFDDQAIFDDDAFSRSFLYNIRTRVGLLTDKPTPIPGEFGTLIDGLNAAKLLAADYLASGGESFVDGDRDAALKRMNGLLKLCHRYYREDRVVRSDTSKFGIDGAMLARFLATGGKELS